MIRQPTNGLESSVPPKLLEKKHCFEGDKMDSTKLRLYTPLS